MDIPAQPIIDPNTRQDPVNSPSVPDETEVKKEKDALLQNKDYLQIVIEQSPVAIEFYNKEGLLLHVNPACLELFGIKDKSEISKFSLFDDPNISDERKNDLKQGKHIRYEAPFDFNKVKELHLYNSSKSGQLLLDIIITPIKDGDVVTGYLLQIQDITKRKEAEDALRESEIRYKIIFDKAVEGIAVADLETKRFHYINTAMCRMFGYTEEELLRLGIADIHPKESLSHVQAEFEALLRGEKTMADSLPCLRKDGTIFFTNVSSAPIVLDGRQCLLGFFTDITDRKKVEELLHKSSELYASTISAINDGVWDWDVQTGNAFFSEAYYKMLGYNDKEFPANYTTWKSLVHPDDVERAEKELQEGIVSEKGRESGADGRDADRHFRTDESRAIASGKNIRA
jgi:PAS domain S-box-containing protein